MIWQVIGAVMVGVGITVLFVMLVDSILGHWDWLYRKLGRWLLGDDDDD